MKQLLLTLATVGVLAGLISLSRSDSTDQGKPPVDPNAIQAFQGEKNPWTSLKVNNDPDQFSFAVVADRTGEHRGQVFERAIAQLNLLQPQFVMSVGDFIEGMNYEPKILAAEWKEFQGYVKKLEMPFFYVAGNHELANDVQIAEWDKRFGKRYYYQFMYKRVLFLVLNCEYHQNATIDKKQQEWALKTLEANKDVRWTFIFVHRPQIWWDEHIKKSGWEPIEKTLAGRKYNVFVGHIHNYATYERNGMTYYQLATTGGKSRVRGPDYREVDHFAWVTMKKEAPVVAQILLDGVLDGNFKKPLSKEEGVVRETRHPVEGKLTIDGVVEKVVMNAKKKETKVKVASRVTITFHTFNPKNKQYTEVADGLTDAWGRFQISTHNRFDGCPAGNYTVTAAKTGPGYYDGDVPEEKQLPKMYHDPKTSPLRATIKQGLNEVKLEVVTK